MRPSQPIKIFCGGVGGGDAGKGAAFCESDPCEGNCRLFLAFRFQNTFCVKGKKSESFGWTFKV